MVAKPSSNFRKVGEPCERGRLMDHHLGLGSGERVDNGVAIEHIQNHRRSAGGAKRIHLAGRGRGADHRVGALDEHGDETTP